MLQICSRMSFNFAQAKKYVIVKSKYLIEAPPRKPASGFGLYVKEQFGQNKSGKATQVISQASQSWKNLNSEVKSTLENKYKESRDLYEKQKEQYTNKFVIPFKRLTSQGLTFSHIHKNNVIQKSKDIRDYGKQIGEKLKQITSEQSQKFKKEAEEINQKRKSLQEQFKFPERLHHSQSSFSRANNNIDPKQRARAYKLYVEGWYKSVAKWLKANNIDLSISDFKRLYNRSLKKSDSKNTEEALVEKSKEELGIKEETKKVASASKK